MRKTPCIYYKESANPNQSKVDRIAIKLDGKNGIPYIWAIYMLTARAIEPDDVTLVMDLAQARQVFDIMSAEEYARPRKWDKRIFTGSDGLEPHDPAHPKNCALTFMTRNDLDPAEIIITEHYDRRHRENQVTVWYRRSRR